MKKVYLFVLTVMAAGAVNAQLFKTNEMAAGAKKLSLTMPQTESHPGTAVSHDRATVWEDGFETPGDWTAAGPSGDYEEWGWSIGSSTNDWYGFDPDMGTTGNFARFRNGEPGDEIENGPFTLEYNLPIDVSTATAATLEWEQYGARFITLQAVEMSTDGGSSWVIIGDNSDIPALTTTGGDIYGKPETRSFPLFCDLGGATTINLRLHWDGLMNGGSMNYVDYGWFVDNIRVVDGVPYDIVNDNTYHRSGIGLSFDGGLEYYMIPTEQITEIEFSGNCSNNGGMDHDGANLNVDVDMGGSVYNESSAAITLPTCSSDSLSGAPAFTPSGLGDYDITYTFSGTNPDDVTTGDVVTDAIEVTDYIYGRDNGVVTNTIGQLNGNDGEFMTVGNIMDIYGNGVIGAVDVGLSGDAANVDQEIYAEIHWFDGTDFVQVAMTPEHVITAGENGGMVKLFFEEAVEVVEGDLIMVTVGHYGGPEPPRFNMCQPTVAQSVQGYIPSGGYSLADPEAIMIRLDMRDFESVEEQINNNLTIGQNVPNPFNQNSVITYTLNEAANVNVTFTDASGKVVLNMNEGNQAAGEYQIQLDGNDFSEGIYFYTFTAGETVMTKRMIVTK